MPPAAPRSSWARSHRLLAAALATVLAWAIVGPVVVAFHPHEDTRCCANGICCCRPKDEPPGPCVRTVCRCGGHDADPAGAPTAPKFPPVPPFVLTVAPDLREVVAVAVSSLAAGFHPPTYHPPRTPRVISC